MPELTDLDVAAIIDSIFKEGTTYRQGWKALKTKHAAVITQHGIKFKEDLGPLLDKQDANRLKYKNITKSFKSLIPASAKGKPLSDIAKKSIKITMLPQMKAMLADRVKLQAASTSYQEKIKGLGDPAEAELTRFLKLIASNDNLELQALQSNVRKLGTL